MPNTVLREYERAQCTMYRRYLMCSYYIIVRFKFIDTADTQQQSNTDTIPAIRIRWIYLSGDLLSQAKAHANTNTLHGKALH